MEGAKCFFVSNADSTKTKSFFDAQSDCENRGGSLAGIADKAENERVFAQASPFSTRRQLWRRKCRLKIDLIKL